MTDPSRLTPDELTRQAHQHLQSLRSAGIEWLPTAPLPETPPVQEPPPAAARVSPPEALQDVTVAPATNLFALAAMAGGEQAGPSMTLEERRQALQVLATQVSTCTRCKGLAATRTQTVFGIGNPGVELCFI